MWYRGAFLGGFDLSGASPDGAGLFGDRYDAITRRLAKLDPKKRGGGCLE
jgi:hypothetical protein